MARVASKHDAVHRASHDVNRARNATSRECKAVQISHGVSRAVHTSQAGIASNEVQHLTSRCPTDAGGAT
eukprot:CAMPEP_0183402352 /NCGR_PEP_ID=MMETSP0370-20130417/13848_1 /TAXON_ID=268820 /ORGANISM="Peridinium aciculiferum, Strain PAER-2" /LENGTH=69 /DNA_ID=CAMNT_0025583921 /DNA_START=55 /DNA_END=260 /DNA_ORIENTATION=+